jgi:O-Antigen ligase/Tetratricopeptide repeat
VLHGWVTASARSETSVGNADARADAHRLSAILVSAPGALAAVGGIVVVAGTQGGYFPTSWGPSALLLLALIALWLLAGGRTDAGRLDVAFLGLLAAFVCWIALSLVWSEAPAQTTLEVQRALVPLAGVAAVLLLAGRASYRETALAVVAGIVVVSGYGLATRLFPDQLGLYHPISGYRLSEPIGYWNGLGILAVVGALLALGLAVEGGAWHRGIAAASLVVLAPTVYFTFSRGAWLALAVGAAAFLALTPRRLATVGGALLVLPGPALAIAAASRGDALTHRRNDLAEAISDGRRLAVVLVVLAAIACAAGVSLGRVQARVTLSASRRRLVGGVLLASLLLAAIAVVAREGGPIDSSRRAYHAFDTPPPASVTNLNQRLLSLSGSGRVDLWRVALSAYEDNPVLGTGAGTYERSWQRNPNAGFKARDAHSVYLETLAELGPVGLGLLLAALGIPLAACLAARRHPVVPAALGAYVAYLVHAGVDWDWELTGVTLAALLAASVGLLALRTTPPRRLGPMPRILGAVAVVGAAVVLGVGYLGNDALERAEVALQVDNPKAALAEARHARTWAPWSPYPPTVRGEALLALGREGAARKAFRDAIEADPGYWRAWLGLAVASRDGARAAALRHAKRLYPRSIEIFQTEQLLRESEQAGAESERRIPGSLQ